MRYRLSLWIHIFYIECNHTNISSKYKSHPLFKNRSILDYIRQVVAYKLISLDCVIGIICLLKSDIIVNNFRITNNMSRINSHQVLNGSKFSTKNHKLWIHLHSNDIERKHLNKITCHTAAPDHWINIYLPPSVRLNSNLLIMPTYYIIP